MNHIYSHLRLNLTHDVFQLNPTFSLGYDEINAHSQVGSKNKGRSHLLLESTKSMTKVCLQRGRRFVFVSRTLDL